MLLFLFFANFKIEGLLSLLNFYVGFDNICISPIEIGPMRLVCTSLMVYEYFSLLSLFNNAIFLLFWNRKVLRTRKLPFHHWWHSHGLILLHGKVIDAPLSLKTCGLSQKMTPLKKSHLNSTSIAGSDRIKILSMCTVLFFPSVLLLPYLTHWLMI